MHGGHFEPGSVGLGVGFGVGFGVGLGVIGSGLSVTTLIRDSEVPVSTLALHFEGKKYPMSLLRI